MEKDCAGWIPAWLQEFEKGYIVEKKHKHRYKTIIINGNGTRHRKCKCGKWIHKKDRY